MYNNKTMSNIETVRMLEPRVDIKHDSEKNHVVLMGGQRVTQQVNVADSWGDPNSAPVQALFTVNPPSTQTIVDRRMKVRCYLDITTNEDLQLGSNDALRQFPIASIMDVLTVQINGETVSDNVADKIHAMLCYGNDAQSRLSTVSTSPSMPDGYQRYSDWGDYGSAKNPLADYGETALDEGRGGFPVQLLSARNFRCVVTEPLFMSPFLSGFEHQDEGFVNVNQMNISFRWKSDLSKVMSHSQLGGDITQITVKMYQAPEILTSFITPDLTQPIPEMQILPYYKPQEYVKSMSTLIDNASTRVISDTIKLSQIPRKMYLFCRHQRATANQDVADSFLRIDNLSVLWNNQSGLFSSATEQDLFEISKGNGLNLSYPAWRQYRGGVFCAEFGKDVGLLDTEAPGCQGQYTIQIQMDVTNVAGESFTPEFYTVFVNEGTFSLSEQFARASLGNLSPQMVLAAKSAHQIHHIKYEQLQGGSFFSSLKNIVSKVAHGVSSVARNPMVQSAVGAIAPEFSPLVSAVGSLGKKKGGALIGGRRRLSRK